jgi:hypothetical protein
MGLHGALRDVFHARRNCIVDQPFQPCLPDGMVRCYMGADKLRATATSSSRR